MEFTELLETRRSIRNYKPDISVDRKTIEELIKAAQQAPSWKNFQTGRYYIALSEEKLEKIRSALPEFNRKNTENASALIITAFVKKNAGFDKDGNPDNELGDEWGAYDLGLQNENLILKARELGFDTLIMGIRDSEKLRKEFDIPDDQQIAAVISVGQRNGEPVKPPRKEIDEIAVFY